MCAEHRGEGYKLKARERHEAFIKRWKAGEEAGMKGTGSISRHIRRYLMETHGEKCMRCGWNEIHPVTGNIPVEVNHIDGNFRNNKEENLEVLCPNCHSLTDSYRALNIGRGRPGR